MNNELHNRLLAAARDKVAYKMGWQDWDGLMTNLEDLPIPNTIDDLNKEAALLAMEELAAFHSFWLRLAKKHMADNGVIYIEDSESELYDQWEGERNG